jgi:hypothetical protein
MSELSNRIIAEKQRIIETCAFRRKGDFLIRTSMYVVYMYVAIVHLENVFACVSPYPAADLVGTASHSFGR